MKKHFEKPALSRCEIRLNENIALSWEYYIEGELTSVFHFTHLVNSAPVEDGGCYDYYKANLEWTTSEDGHYGNWFRSQTRFTNINSMNSMIAWMNELDNDFPAFNCET